MSRSFIALAAAVFVAAAAPAAAFSIQFSLPTLTYPTQPGPDASQGCAQLTTLNGETCPVPSK